MYSKLFLLLFISFIFLSCGGDNTSDNKDLCKNIVCENDGTCKEGKCECKEGFTGDKCETEVTTDNCDPNPCLNGGICTSTTDSYTCKCKEGFTGDKCETEVTNRCTDNADCDDSDPCTDDSCEVGVCHNTEKTCDDGNQCTDDSCNSGECQHSNNNNNSCDDGDASTVNDICNAGICTGTPMECTTNTDCNDNDPCTDDVCNQIGYCSHQPTSGNSCDDGDTCTHTDICNNGVCSGILEQCDDDNPCTVGSCNGAGGCTFQALVDGSTCDDGDASTIGDVCDAGVCTGTTTQCITNADCDDANHCTNDSCEAGVCHNITRTCNDDNQCTNDACDFATGQCIYQASEDGTSCDDGYSCTIGSVCESANCNIGEVISGYILDNNQCIEMRPFVTEWNTANNGVSSNTQVKITVDTHYNYDYSIDCDYDGTFDTTATQVTGNYTCNYDTEGVYRIAIQGVFPKIYFGYNNNDAKKLLNVVQWGDIHWLSMEKAFKSCTNMNITATDTPDLSEVTSMEGMFSYASSMNANINNWNVSHVTNMIALFQEADSFNQPLNNWDVSNVTSMRMMFYMINDFNQPLNNWDVSSVTDMKSMFQWASKFNQDLSGWSVCNVTNHDDFDAWANNWDEVNKPNFTCIEETCTDGIKNQGETDIDCGGDICAPCEIGNTCYVTSDCRDGLNCSRDGLCYDPNAPTCADGIKNQDETDIDCGGNTCVGCSAGEDCIIASDCARGLTCSRGKCD